MIIAIVVVIIALLAGTLFFSGVVTFEEDDEESDGAEGVDTKGEHLVKAMITLVGFGTLKRKNGCLIPTILMSEAIKPTVRLIS